MLKIKHAFVLVALFLVPVTTLLPASVSAVTDPDAFSLDRNTSVSNKKTTDQCGVGPKAVKTKLNFGCRGDELVAAGSTTPLNPILDLFFALLRFFSVGVGVYAVFWMVVAGIRYSTARGDSNATAEAKRRIRNIVIALLMYVFVYTIANFLVPGGIFN